MSAAPPSFPRALPIGRRDAAWPAAVVAAGDSGGGDACCVAAATALPAHPRSTRTGPAPADSSCERVHFPFSSSRFVRNITFFSFVSAQVVDSLGAMLSEKVNY